jgi:hypothetical protein
MIPLVCQKERCLAQGNLASATASVWLMFGIKTFLPLHVISVAALCSCFSCSPLPDWSFKLSLFQSIAHQLLLSYLFLVFFHGRMVFLHFISPLNLASNWMYPWKWEANHVIIFPSDKSRFKPRFFRRQSYASNLCSTIDLFIASLGRIVLQFHFNMI